MWASLAQLHCRTARATQSHQPEEKHNHPASNFLKSVMTMEKCSKVGLAEQMIKRLYPNSRASHSTHPASSVSYQAGKHADVWAEQPGWAGSHGSTPRETASTGDRRSDSYKRRNSETLSTVSEERQSSNIVQTWERMQRNKRIISRVTRKYSTAFPAAQGWKCGSRFNMWSEERGTGHFLCLHFTGRV